MHVGFVGLGNKAQMHADTIAAMDGIESTVGADVSSDARDHFADGYGVRTYADYEAMLVEEAESLDAVIISTPHTLHCEHAMACLERDLDVFLEKPMVTDVADAVRLVDAVEEREAVLAVGFQRHHDPAYQEIRRVLEAGRLGDINLLSGHLAHEWIDSAEETWRRDPALSGGGQLFDSGAHLLDLALWQTDATPGTVAAAMDDRNTAVDVNSAVAATLECEGGPVTASLSVGGDTATFAMGLQIHGTDGHLSYDNGETILVSTADDTERIDVGEMDRSGINEVLLGDFFESVRSGEDPAAPASYGLQITALMEAARLAHERGETVDASTLIDEARAEVLE
jgi:predicted dehydrogenase